MREFTTIFMALIFETTPFLLAGVFISVALGPWLERALGGAAFRSPAAGMLAGVGAGIVAPMCDCGSRPLVHRLALAGRREFAVAFMITAPVLNPIVVITTWLAFRDPELVALRMGLTIVIALVAATLLSLMRAPIALPAAVDDHDHGHGWTAVPGRTLTEFFELFGFLVFGSALAAAVQVFVDRDVLTSQQGVFLSVGAMMALAFLLSICSSVDAFVAAGFGAAAGTGPILAFLVLGPQLSLKVIPLYLRLFTVPALAVLSVVVLQVVFTAAVVVQLRGW